MVRTWELNYALQSGTLPTELTVSWIFCRLNIYFYILESRSFKGHSTGAHHKIQGHITCTTSNMIYLISCRICGIQYIGETKNSLKKWFCGHRSTVKTHKVDTPVGHNTSIYLITPFLTWSCRALRRGSLTTGNQQRKYVDQVCPPPWS